MPRSHTLVSHEDLGRSRLAVNELIVGEFSVENFARYSFALYVIAVLAAGTPGMRERVSALRLQALILKVTFFNVTREGTVILVSFRLLRSTRNCGHFSSF